MTINIKGYDVLIDDEDYEKISNRKWRVKKNSENCIYFINQKYDAENYRRTGNPSCAFYLHRIIMGLVKGDGKIVDHINGNTLDCRKVNLRIVNKAQNQFNAKMQKNNTTGLKGVTRRTKNRWQARIMHYGKYTYLGLFDSPEKAHAAYCEASKKYHGEYGRTE